MMRRVLLNLPTFGAAVATRAALGVGLGLLLAGRLEPERRRIVGTALVAVGAATTIPILRAILRGRNEAAQLQIAEP